MNNGFLVTMLNWKGGVGKSNLAYHLIRNFDFFGMDFDTTGNLSDRLGDDYVQYVDVTLDPSDLDLTGFNVIADFGGNRDPREMEMARQSDVIIIPYTPTVESVMSTQMMLEQIKDVNVPIIFVATRVTAKVDEEALLDTLDQLIDVIGNKEIKHYVIRERENYQMVWSGATPIMELKSKEFDKNGRKINDKMRERPFKAIKEELKGLNDLIMMYKG